MRCGLLLIGVWLAACGQRFEHHEARVDAYVNPAYRVSRDSMFCFVPAAQAYPQGPLMRQRRYAELTRICAEHGQRKGVRIFVEQAPECFPTHLAWSVGNQTAWRQPPASPVGPLLAHNGPIAQLQAAPPPPPPMHHQQPPPPVAQPPASGGLFPLRQSGPRFRKTLTLVATRPGGQESLVEATAVMWSDLDAFTDATAEVLCRALFQDFPSRVKTKRYTVKLPEP